MSLSARSVLIAACVVFVTAVTAAVTHDGLEEAIQPVPMPTIGTPVTSAPPTTAPPVFPPVTAGFDARAVRTPAGLVLPVVAGFPRAWEVRTPCGATAVVDGVPVRGVHVVLDPGHGGSEPGAVGPSGLLEKELNLDVALRTRARLEALGATVVLTRPTDIRVTLATRGELVSRIQPLAFVSIHHNAAPLTTGPTPGSELYHHLADPRSQRLAGLLWEEFQKHLAPFGTDWAVGDDPGARARRSIATGDDFYGVLRRSQGVPAVLSEAGFISHPPEEALQRTDAFRDAEAQAITDALVRFVSTDDPGSGFRAVKEAAAPAGGGGGSTGCVDPPL